MTQRNDSAIAVFDDHRAADAAVGELIEAGFDMRHFSVIGKGYHTDERVVGFYNTGDRMKFWGKYGAFWGGLWGLFFGGLFVTLPAVGPVIVLGYLAGMVVSAIEGAVVVGGLTALGAALVGIGIPKDSVIRYETALKADNFLVVAHGPADEIARAKETIERAGAVRVDLNECTQAQASSAMFNDGLRNHIMPKRRALRWARPLQIDRSTAGSSPQPPESVRVDSGAARLHASAIPDPHHVVAEQRFLVLDFL
jgi:hypothetical protein